MKRTVFSVLAIATTLLVLVGCGSPGPKTYLEETADIAARFDDAIMVARNTPRMQLSGVISDLQEIQREAEKLEAPEEAHENKEHLLEWMEYTITGFLAFMGQEEDRVVDLAFAYAEGALKQYVKTRAELEK